MCLDVGGRRVVRFLIGRQGEKVDEDRILRTSDGMFLVRIKHKHHRCVKLFFVHADSASPSAHQTGALHEEKSFKVRVRVSAQKRVAFEDEHFHGLHRWR